MRDLGIIFRELTEAGMHWNIHTKLKHGFLVPGVVKEFSLSFLIFRFHNPKNICMWMVSRPALISSFQPSQCFVTCDL